MPIIKPAGQTGTTQAADSGGGELNEIRGKIDALLSDGDYAACANLIESSLKTIYENERWPEDFFAVLRTYQRCYPYLKKSGSAEERVADLLRACGVPFVFAYLLQVSDASITWNTDYFKNLALKSERGGDLETALSYCDVAVKMDANNSGVFVTRGWILDDLERHEEAEEMFTRAVELNEANHSARNSLAKHLAAKNPQLALEHAEKAIELSPTEGSYYDTKAKILVRLNERAAAIVCYDLASAAAPYVADYPYQKAELLLADGKEIAAIALYRKAMALDDKHLPTLWRLVRFYMETQPDLALTYLNTITSVQPDSKDASLLRGVLLGTLGEHEAAAEEFMQLLDTDPRCHEALGGYANLILNDDPEEAIEYFNRALALSPKNAGYHTGKARAYERLDRIPQAIKEYREVVSIDPNDARAYGRLGALLTDTKPAEALECYTRAAALMPDNAHYHTEKAELLLAQKRFAEAIDAFSAASQLDPSNAQIHTTLAVLLEQAGNATSALEHYKQATSLNPGDAVAFYGLARLLLETAPEMALLHINSAISLDDGNGEYYYFKSKVLNILGHNKHALEQLIVSLRADGKNPEALSELSEIISSDEPQTALMYINRAIELSPANADYLCTRGNLLLSMKQPAKALAQFEDAHKKDPKNGDALFGIGRCLVDTSDKKALDFFNKAIAANPNAVAYHEAKAELLAAMGSPSEAILAYDAAIALEENNWKCLFGRTEMYEAVGDDEAALEGYKATLAVNPDCIGAAKRLGVMLADRHPEEALGYLDIAIDDSPDEYIFHVHKGSALLALGQKDEAAAAYRRASFLGHETPEIHYMIADLLKDKLPETALGYCMRAIDENPGDPSFHVLCGKVYLSLEQIGSALDQFKSAILLNHACHEAYEYIADIFYENNDPATLDAANAALKSKPDCITCILRQINIIEKQDDIVVEDLIAQLDYAVKLAPDSIPARKKLVELLEQKRAPVRLALERRKLAKLMKNAGKAPKKK